MTQPYKRKHHSAPATSMAMASRALVEGPDKPLALLPTSTSLLQQPRLATPRLTGCRSAEFPISDPQSFSFPPASLMPEPEVVHPWRPFLLPFLCKELNLSLQFSTFPLPPAPGLMFNPAYCYLNIDDLRQVLLSSGNT